jgi:hypothetical protein
MIGLDTNALVRFLVRDDEVPLRMTPGVVEMDGGALEKARKRAQQLKLRNVEFIQGDIRNIALPGPFDAAVGRVVTL